MEELGLSEVETNTVCMEESLWERQHANEKDSSWLDAVLATLPDHFNEGIKERVRASILSAGVLSEEQLRNMSAADVAASRVPLAARRWLSDQKYKNLQALPPAAVERKGKERDGVRKRGMEASSGGGSRDYGSIRQPRPSLTR